jgi:hypothetical protein
MVLAMDQGAIGGAMSGARDESGSNRRSDGRCEREQWKE